MKEKKRIGIFGLNSKLYIYLQVGVYLFKLLNGHTPKRLASVGWIVGPWVAMIMHDVLILIFTNAPWRPASICAGSKNSHVGREVSSVA